MTQKSSMVTAAAASDHMPREYSADGALYVDAACDGFEVIMGRPAYWLSDVDEGKCSQSRAEMDGDIIAVVIEELQMMDEQAI